MNTVPSVSVWLTVDYFSDSTSQLCTVLMPYAISGGRWMQIHALPIACFGQILSAFAAGHPAVSQSLQSRANSCSLPINPV